MTELIIKILFFIKIRFRYSNDDLLFMICKNTLKLNYLVGLISLISFSYLLYNIEQSIWIIPFFILVVFFLFQLFKQYYFNVLLIYSDKIEIQYPSNISKTEIFHFSDIRKIVYYPPFRTSPNHIRIFINKHQKEKMQYAFYIDQDIYKFASILKFLKGNGVQIDFAQRDVEIEGFIDGRFDKIPLANKY